MTLDEVKIYPFKPTFLEMRKHNLCLLLSQFLKYISIAIPFKPKKYFLKIKKKLSHGSHSALEMNEGFSVDKMKTIVESMVKEMLRTKVQLLRKRA